MRKKKMTNYRGENVLGTELDHDRARRSEFGSHGCRRIFRSLFHHLFNSRFWKTHQAVQVRRSDEEFESNMAAASSVRFSDFFGLKNEIDDSKIIKFSFCSTFDGCCDAETELEIEVWDWDRFTPDDRIGSVCVKLGALKTGTTIALNPPENGSIKIHSIEYRGMPTPQVQLCGGSVAAHIERSPTLHDPAIKAPHCGYLLHTFLS